LRSRREKAHGGAPLTIVFSSRKPFKKFLTDVTL
jgi:hypothetical protein